VSKFIVTVISLFGVLLFTGTASPQAGDDLAKLKKELDQLKREGELHKKEIELLKKEIEPLKAKAKAMPDSKYLGRWKLVNEKGVVSSYLTITKLGALRDHAPKFPGSLEVVGNEVRLKWEDGFRDILRLGSDGKMTLYALDRVGADEETDWQGSPRFLLNALRIPK